MAISPIPTPGNVGANELTFFGIFRGVFPRKYIGYAVIMYSFLVYYIMYSFLVYYFILLVCGVCTWISHYYMNKLESKGELEKISREEDTYPR